MVKDIHSYANPHESRVRHVHLRLKADFEARRLSGTATIELDPAAGRVVLDTRGLEIVSVSRPWRLGAADPILGAPLEIELRPGDRSVAVEYATGPDASALQWLDAGEPFLFTQSEAIHARSWAPVPDSPGVRFTWSAEIDVPAGLRALTSGGHLPVPAYLMALAIGRLEFAAISERAGVWAPPALLHRARNEFEDMERMIQATERLFGPYRWGRYDVLVMPPSFPFGGMENPCLTFATPTILAGDKSLVSLVAHELAHSWSGNLVTNATWRDFWLNEGFTTYIERRIQEEIYGERRARMEATLEMGELRAEMARLPEADQRLAIDLAGRDPDDGCTLVPYFKGAAMLRRLEQIHGRERFDQFVRGYFDHFAFRSLTTEQFIEYFERELGGYDVRPWIFESGLPADVPETQFEFESEPRDGWTTQEWLHWLRALPESPDLAGIDRRWRLTMSGNSEILCEWLRLSVKHDYEPGFAKLEEFLCSVGRRKFLKPIYEELKKTGRAAAFFEKAKHCYHPIARAEIERLLA